MFAIIFSALTVTILSTFITEFTFKLFDLSEIRRISFSFNFSGTTELIADTTKSLYLSFVKHINTLGLTFR